MSTPVVPAYRQRTGYHAAFLGSVALLASALLVIGDLQTRDEIAARRIEDTRASLAEVLPASIRDNDPVADPLVVESRGRPFTVYRASREDTITAVAFESAAQGYGGEIRVILGVAGDGRLLGVRVLAHAETPGLGDKIEAARSNWIRGFDGLSLDNTPASDWAVRKDGGRFDQFSGATITPRAVVKAVHAGLEFFARERERLLAAPVNSKTTEHPERERQSLVGAALPRTGMALIQRFSRQSRSYWRSSVNPVEGVT